MRRCEQRQGNARRVQNKMKEAPNVRCCCHAADGNVLLPNIRARAEAMPENARSLFRAISRADIARAARQRRQRYCPPFALPEPPSCPPLYAFVAAKASPRRHMLMPRRRLSSYLLMLSEEVFAVAAMPPFYRLLRLMRRAALAPPL